jgi:hypothetical protein
VPSDLGRVGIDLTHLLESAPAAVDDSAIAPSEALQRAEQIVTSASGMLELLGDEVPVLSEALGADVARLSLTRLHEVAEAVVGLSTAPRAVPGWGHALEAQGADIALHVSEADLRHAAETHAAIYERFTEGVWDVAPRLLGAGRRPWRMVARRRLRRHLRSVSRTGRVPGRLRAVATEVLDATATRARLAALSPLLAHHLGALDRGPLSDVDAALEALGAVRRLQSALGELLDGHRLERLLLADAFRSPDVVGPAVTIRSILQAWVNDVAGAGGQRPLARRADEVERWALEVAVRYRDVQRALEVLDRIDAPPPTLRSLVDSLILREHVEGLGDDVDPAPAAPVARIGDHAGSAS